MITIVSGIPRSGTSLMMRLLEAYGLPLLVDNMEPADKCNNPYGYFEWTGAPKLSAFPDLIGLANNRAVKLLSHHAMFIPSGREYRCVFMLRNLDKIISSQSAFVTRNHSVAAFEYEKAFAGLRKHRAIVKRFLLDRCEGRVFFVDYDYLVDFPLKACTNIACFLEQYNFSNPNSTCAKAWEMSSKILPDLRHHRS